MSLRTTVIHVLQPIKVAVELATLIGQQLTLSDSKAESYGLGFKLKNYVERSTHDKVNLLKLCQLSTKLCSKIY